MFKGVLSGPNTILSQELFFTKDTIPAKTDRPDPREGKTLKKKKKVVKTLANFNGKYGIFFSYNNY
jgi:hypothetical protein